MDGSTILPEISSWDWGHVFEYATPGVAKPGSKVDTTKFNREDVVKVYASQDGDNDGPDWVCFGKLKDGRYFSIRAGCDYTGWG